MKIVKILPLIALVSVCFTATVPKKDPPARCKRLVWLIPVAIALAGAGVGLIVKEQEKAHYIRSQQEELIRQHNEIQATSTEASTTPVVRTTTSTTTTTTSTTPAPRTMLLNYELDNFQYIPRSLFMFMVEPLPGYANIFVEYLLINPDYSATTSPDRIGHRFGDNGGPNQDTVDPEAVSQEQFWTTTRSIGERINTIQRRADIIHRRVAEANSRLRQLQQAHFSARAEALRQGLDPNVGSTRALNSAFFNEVDRLRVRFDERTTSMTELISLVRQRDCIQYGLAMASHARRSGVVALPHFYISAETPGYTPLSEEERRWLANPTTEWFPRQSTIQTTFGRDEEDGPHDPAEFNSDHPHRYYQELNHPFNEGERPEAPFRLPDYTAQYALVLPVFDQRTLPNEGVNVGSELYPDTSSDDDSSSSDDSDDNGYPRRRPGDSSSDESVQITDDVIVVNSSEDEAQVVSELNSTSDEEDNEIQQCGDEYQVAFKKPRLQKRNIKAEETIATCTFRGGKRLRKFMQLFH